MGRWEGPHIFRTGPDRFTIRRYLTDPAADNAELRERAVLQTPPFTFQDFAIDDQTYVIEEPADEREYAFTTGEKILACGDVHGKYDLLVGFLCQTGAIDNGRNWAFGRGRLVFCGDIFDRGEQVTECLWLIYRLEQQARAAGGAVHLLLGNHEVMIMNDDTRYLAAKYRRLEATYRFSYSSLFSADTLLGQWLRTKNTMIKINDILFVHGGVSPEMVARRLDTASINQIVREHLRGRRRDGAGAAAVLGPNGPLWYRGYLSPWYDAPVSPEQIDDILSFYQVNKIVFAHTPVPRIKPLFDAKLFAIDAPLEKHTPYEALWIENEEIFAVNDEGTKRRV